MDCWIVCKSRMSFTSAEICCHWAGEKETKGFLPAFISPVLTLSLSFLQILTELEHSGVGRIKEQSARMLGHLVSNAPRLIRPYMEPILKVESRQFLMTLK